MVRQQVDIVLAGGASHVVGLAGAASALDTRVDIRRVGGSSAGSIAAAAIAIGMVGSGIKDALRKLLTPKLLDLSWWPLHRFGIYAGDEMLAALKEVFGDRRMSEVYIPLRVVVCDLYERRPVTISSDHAGHGQLKIADVLRCSAAIPVFFKAHVLPEIWGNRLFVDGGTAANFAMGMFDDSSRKTVGVRLCQEAAGDAVPVRTLGDYGRAVADLLMWSSNNAHISSKRWQDVVNVPAPGSGLDFNLTASAFDERWRLGENAAVRWCDERECRRGVVR